MSYKQLLNVVTELSKHHAVPLQKWLSEGEVFKFVGDNFDRKRVVRDIRSDHHGELTHMYSLLVVKGRVKPPQMCQQFDASRLIKIPLKSLLPNRSDVSMIQSNLKVLVSRVLCKYLKSLSRAAGTIPQHILHTHSTDMSSKSEVAVLDVLHKNEAKHSDMLEIMKEQQAYLGDKYVGTVLSGGDQLTQERQRCSKQHMMDADTPTDRLEHLEPCIEDWHALQSFLGVSNIVCVQWSIMSFFVSTKYFAWWYL